MKTILLTKGEFALVDDADYDFLMQTSWCYASEYAQTYWKPTGERVFMQWLLLPRKEGLVVDHHNRFKLDNRRKNLRYITKSEDCVNRELDPRNKTGFPGIAPSPIRGFNVWAKRNRKAVYLGRYDTLERAVEVRTAYTEHGIVPSPTERMRADNACGVRGVCFHKGKWMVRIDNLYRGRFVTLEEAAQCAAAVYASR